MKRVAIILALMFVLVGAYGCRQTPTYNDVKPVKLTAKDEAAVVKGLDWLVANQGKDGLWRGAGKYTLPVSCMAGLALLSHAEEDGSMDYVVAVRRLANFLVENTDLNSGFLCHNITQSETLEDVDDRPAYGHAFGLLFLTQAWQSEKIFKQDELKRIRATIIAAIRFIEKHQHPTGCWYQNYINGHNEIVTASHMQALMAARAAGFDVNRKTLDKALEFNAECLNKPASPARLSSFAAAQLVSGDQDGEALVRGLKGVNENCKKLNKADISTMEFPNFYQLYTSMVCYYMGGRWWTDYYAATSDWYVKHQNADGSWPEMKKVHAVLPSKEYSTAVACMVLQMPKRALPIFACVKMDLAQKLFNEK